MKKVKQIIGLDNQVQYVSTPADTKVDDKSYLARHAGLETVQTSMKGLLGDDNQPLKRKKLLGE